MKLNLRKARKLDSKIQQHLGTSPVKFAASVRVRGVIAEAKNTIKDEVVESEKQLATNKELITTRFSIRKKISMVNEASGINQLMARREEVLATLKQYSKVEMEKYYDDEELVDLLDTKRAALDKGEHSFRGPETSVKVGTLSDNMKEAFQQEIYTLRKELESIEDSLGQKNLGSKITLSEEEVELLEGEKLL